MDLWPAMEWITFKKKNSTTYHFYFQVFLFSNDYGISAVLLDMIVADMELNYQVLL